MILEFSITNTFSIKERQTISFETAVHDDESDKLHCVEIDNKKILRTACLYGANASGKTNMITALRFYLRFIIDSYTGLKPTEHIHFLPFLFDKATAAQPGEFNIIFYMKDAETHKYIRYEYTIQLTNKEVIKESLSYAPKGQIKLLYERMPDKPVKWGTDITGSKKIIADMTRPNSSLLSAGAQAHHPLFVQLYEYLSNRFKGMLTPADGSLSEYVLRHIEKDAAYKQQIIGLFNASDLGKVTDIKVKTEIIPQEFIKQLPQDVQEEIAKHPETAKSRKATVIHQYNGTDFELPLSYESSGTVRMMELVAPLNDLAAGNSVVLIDEIESSLHQELVETFLKIYLQSYSDSQLVFTTQDQDLLDSGLLRDDEIWFCYKTNKGDSVYHSLTDYTGIRKEASRKKLYQAGKFGALPNVDIGTLTELFSAKKDRKNSEQ